jgi:hypothetical protein
MINKKKKCNLLDCRGCHYESLEKKRKQKEKRDDIILWIITLGLGGGIGFILKLCFIIG